MQSKVRIALSFSPPKARLTHVSGSAAVVKVLEDSPLYNAGRGAVFTHEGTHELDASIMDGNGRKVHSVYRHFGFARVVPNS
jgi:isoaspartyl peptidase/L-asparaginase-like protein (Ntn-hydrolase superfamily)